MIGSWRWCTLMVVCLVHSSLCFPATSTTPSIIVTAAASPSTPSDAITVEASNDPIVSSSSSTTEAPSSTTTETAAGSSTTPDGKTDVRYQPKITSMHVESNVTLRYAKTLVTSKVSNPDTRANEVTFSVVIPETAFITAFSMEIDGKVYDAYVKEKDEAKKEYQTAVSSGIAAAHVAVKARDSNHFTVSVNVEPQKKAIFRLYYEELLSRRLGLYNLVMNLSPGQLVEDFAVDVDITETAPITAVYVPSLRTGNEIDADPSDAPNQYAKQTISEDKLNAKIHFAPTKAEQLELMKAFKEREKPTPAPVQYFSVVDRNPKPSSIEEGVKGQFVVQYDVDREVKSEVMLNDGYFVHFFAPGSLKPLNKHVIFVLDVSGSMIGRKISQLKEAMTSILEDLNPGDYFSILAFHYSVKVYNLEDPSKNAVFRSSGNNYMYPWYDDDEKSQPEVLPPPYPATKENIDKAKAIIKSLDASGGTNIHDALATALKVANAVIQMTKMTPEAEEDKRLPEPMVIFLTDGDPTVGETNPDRILETVKSENPKKVAIFSLAFGEDADRSFLRRVALQNSGFLRHIYEAADAAQQLRHFYKLVASPLLSNVTFNYPKEQIDETTITKKKFDYYFLGSELVVAGKLTNKEEFNLPLKLHANAYTGPIDFIPIVLPEEKRKTFWPLERMWAYISIKQLLDERDEKGGKAEDLTDPDSPAKKALDLALKYSFVTPLTSLVVVKPNSTAAVDAESVDASGADVNHGFALPLIVGGNAASYYSQMAPQGFAMRASLPMASSWSSSYMMGHKSPLRMSSSRRRHKGHRGRFGQSSAYGHSASGKVSGLPYKNSVSAPRPIPYPVANRNNFYAPQRLSLQHPPALPGKPQPLWLSAPAAVAIGGVVSNDHLQHQQRMEKTARNYYFVSAAPAPQWLADPIVQEDSIDRFDYDANRRLTTVLPARRYSAVVGLAGAPQAPPQFYPLTTPRFFPTFTPASNIVHQESADFDSDFGQTQEENIDSPTQDKNSPIPEKDNQTVNKVNQVTDEDSQTQDKQGQTQSKDNQTSVVKDNKTQDKDSQTSVVKDNETADKDNKEQDKDSQTPADKECKETDLNEENDKAKTNETQTLTSEERLKFYGLEAYPWLMEYLDAKEDAFSIPLPSKSTLKYNIMPKTRKCLPQVPDEPCAKSVKGEAGVCLNLRSCRELDRGFKDLETYLNYHCDAHGYAGICC